jgi:hypothetical protein
MCSERDGARAELILRDRKSDRRACAIEYDATLSVSGPGRRIITHQIATRSECRYRWLRVPATNRKSLIEAF